MNFKFLIRVIVDSMKLKEIKKIVIQNYIYEVLQFKIKYFTLKIPKWTSNLKFNI